MIKIGKKDVQEIDQCKTQSSSSLYLCSFYLIKNSR